MASPEKEKRCLYEVLGLNRDCTADEIRSAYRRLALQRHPDKLVQSGVSEAEATAQFQELVNAYEVLSDPRERAWYDSHRSQILFSNSAPAANSSNSVCVPDLFSYFSNSVYSGYSDSGKGFYKVYGEVFDKIYQNELNFAKKLGLALPKEAPLMGNLESPYAQVTAFYNYWLGFVTLMDFCWVDQYDVMAGPNRKSRRVMEDENKKLRKKARKEYNETVRGLAEFVKKRDKRVIDMQMKRNEEMERKREKERERKKELEQQKAERARKYEEPEWAQVEEMDDEEIEESIDENEKKKGDGNELYCIACRKKFKSEKQWKNHEQSKKHKEKVSELKEAFDEEDEEYEEAHGDAGKEEDRVREGTSFLSQDDGMHELTEEFEKRVGVQKDDDEAQSSEEDRYSGSNDGIGFKDLGTEMGLDDDQDSTLESMVLGHKNRKNVGPKQRTNPAAKKAQVEVDNDEMDFMEYNNLKSTRRNRGGRRQSVRTQEEAVQADVAETSGQALEDNGPSESAKVEELSSHSFPENEASDKGDYRSESNHKHPKPVFDKRDTAKQENNFKSREPAKGRKKKASTKVSGDFCEKCGEEFESRTKLHKHLRDTGHATLKSR